MLRLNACMQTHSMEDNKRFNRSYFCLWFSSQVQYRFQSKKKKQKKTIILRVMFKCIFIIAASQLNRNCINDPQWKINAKYIQVQTIKHLYNK